jgi:hypothetical protein
MRARLRPVLVWAATYLVALHAILVVIAPYSVALAGPDPLLTLCHSVATDDSAPAHDIPSSVCNHCVLCSLTAATVPAEISSNPPALVPTGYLSPLLAAILLPLRSDRSHGARAPPQLM